MKKEDCHDEREWEIEKESISWQVCHGFWHLIIILAVAQPLIPRQILPLFIFLPLTICKLMISLNGGFTCLVPGCACNSTSTLVSHWWFFFIFFDISTPYMRRLCTVDEGRSGLGFLSLSFMLFERFEMDSCIRWLWSSSRFAFICLGWWIAVIFHTYGQLVWVICAWCTLCSLELDFLIMSLTVMYH